MDVKMMKVLEGNLIEAMESKGIPSYMHDGVVLYVLNGIEPGSFLSALFCNDFKGTFGRADDSNRSLMFQWAELIYNDVPSLCQGSKENFNQWLKMGGVKGKREIKK